MRELAEKLIEETRLSSLKRFLTTPRRVLAVLYAYTICSRLEDCVLEASIASALYVEALMENDRLDTSWLPSHIRVHVERALSDAEDAALRAPSSLYAQIGLDADLLARIGALSMLATRGLGADNLRDLLAKFAESLSYAYAADYIVYTKPAKSLVQILRPHTIAMAKWLVEELSLLGIDSSIKAERSAGGLVAYIDIRSCLGARASKLVSVKPSSNCVIFKLDYECILGNMGYKICIPETTRTR